MKRNPGGPGNYPVFVLTVTFIHLVKTWKRRYFIAKKKEKEQSEDKDKSQATEMKQETKAKEKPEGTENKKENKDKQKPEEPKKDNKDKSKPEEPKKDNKDKPKPEEAKKDNKSEGTEEKKEIKQQPLREEWHLYYYEYDASPNPLNSIVLNENTVFKVSVCCIPIAKISSSGTSRSGYFCFCSWN